MNKHLFISLFLIIFISLPISSFSQQKPNIVIILADDLGNNDLGYRGGKIATPSIDKLANNGMKLESFYGLPVCTPARASLMTGRYPMRYGLQTLVIFPSHTYGLPTTEKTLPELLKKAGYATAMVGKWHLGHADKKYWPQNRGFDYFYGNLVGEVDYFSKERGGVIDWQRNGTFLKDDTYYTDSIGNEAVKLIQQHNTKKPLFLYVAELAPHAPYQALEKDKQQYKNIKSEKRRTHAAMITSVDKQVKQIVDALKEKGMLKNTVIVFSSDNGGVASSLFATGARSPKERSGDSQLTKDEKAPADNGVLRGGKGSLYEGGVRVPTFIYWPNHIKPGVLAEPMHHVDILPTLLYLAKVKEPSAKPLDGRNLWPLHSGQQKTLNRAVLINVEAFRGAVRKGKWKLIKIALMPGKIELYNLDKDPGEKNNVAKQHPEVVKELEGILIDYAKQQQPSKWLRAQTEFLGAQGKTLLDPDFDVDDGGLPHEKPKLPKQ